jgi:hypothetical protein
MFRPHPRITVSLECVLMCKAVANVNITWIIMKTSVHLRIWVLRNIVRGFLPRNTLYTLNTTLHVSTFLGSSSGVLFFHYFRHCNVIFICVLCCVSLRWSCDIVQYGLFVTGIQNTLMVLALGRKPLTILSIYVTGCMKRIWKIWVLRGASYESNVVLPRTDSDI